MSRNKELLTDILHLVHVTVTDGLFPGMCVCVCVCVRACERACVRVCVCVSYVGSTALVLNFHIHYARQLRNNGY